MCVVYEDFLCKQADGTPDGIWSALAMEINTMGVISTLPNFQPFITECEHWFIT